MGLTVSDHPKLYRGGLRAVATLEILKGVAALLASIGLLYLTHRTDLGDAAEDLIFNLHLNPTSRIPWWLIDKAYDVKAQNIHTVIAIACLYSCVRFVEGFGLWHERVWAEWFALLSGALYIPFEVYEILHRPNPIKWAILVINIGIVLYMAYLRFYAHPEAARSVSATKNLP